MVVVYSPNNGDFIGVFIQNLNKIDVENGVKIKKLTS